MTYYWQFTQSKHHVTPYKIGKACYLLRSCLGARRMLLFKVEQQFLLMEEVWSTHNADTQRTVEGTEEDKETRQNLCLIYFLVLLLNVYFISQK